MLRAGVKIRLPAGSSSQPQEAEVAGRSDTSKNGPSREIANVVQASLQAASAAAVSSAIAAGPAIHVVQPGESLFVIAKKYGTTVQALQKNNNLSRRSILKVGATLRIADAAVN
jgi:LysM repeat protein